jgi:hypothetical protein
MRLETPDAEFNVGQHTPFLAIIQASFCQIIATRKAAQPGLGPFLISAGKRTIWVEATAQIGSASQGGEYPEGRGRVGKPCRTPAGPVRSCRPDER